MLGEIPVLSCSATDLPAMGMHAKLKAGFSRIAPPDPYGEVEGLPAVRDEGSVCEPYSPTFDLDGPAEMEGQAAAGGTVHADGQLNLKLSPCSARAHHRGMQRVGAPMAAVILFGTLCLCLGALAFIITLASSAADLTGGSGDDMLGAYSFDSSHPRSMRPPPVPADPSAAPKPPIAPPDVPSLLPTPSTPLPVAPSPHSPPDLPPPSPPMPSPISPHSAPLLVEEDAPELAGSSWSGSCLCPNGRSFSVGAILPPSFDEPSRCVLACIKGVPGKCVSNAPNARPQRKVNCGDMFGDDNWYDTVLNPPESMRRYSLASAGTEAPAMGMGDAVLQQSMLGSPTAWVGVSKNSQGVLYLDLGQPSEVLGVVTQKRKDNASHYVTEFSVRYTVDLGGESLDAHSRDGSTKFHGPLRKSGVDEMVVSWFDRPLVARFFGISPQRWLPENGQAAIRVGLVAHFRPPPSPPPPPPAPCPPSPESPPPPPPSPRTPPLVDLVEENVPGVGVWGGTCLCPSGQEYLVGDNGDFCGSIACVGGVASACEKSAKGGWSHRRVTCGLPPNSPSFQKVLNPPETQRRYSHTLMSARTNGDDQGVRAVVTEINSQLTSSSAWVGVKNTPTQTITIDAGGVVSALGLLVQKPPARMPFYVQTFSIFTWTNSGDGRRGTNRTGGTLFFGPQSYTGANEIVFAWFEKPVSARYFQINPITWHTLPAMRVGVALESGLTSAKCDAMLRDPTHLFRRMWAAEAWGQMGPGKPACFYVVRDSVKTRQPASAYFDAIVTGRDCKSNWFEGNSGPLGWYAHPPKFSSDAPAVLGFDESIDRACIASAPDYARHYGHAERCVKANYNILSLYGDRLPYNICRNLEWQACAAKGELPGQLSPTIRFARAPKTLDPDGATGKPLGQCKGWVPPEKPSTGVYGYATDDIFYLEVCLFNQICTNGHQLFELDQDEPWECAFSIERLRELQEILLEPFVEPADAVQCKHAEFG